MRKAYFEFVVMLLKFEKKSTFMQFFKINNGPNQLEFIFWVDADLIVQIFYMIA